MLFVSGLPLGVIELRLPADAYHRDALEIGLDDALAVGHAWAAELLDPILRALIPAGATWNPAAARWVDQHPRPVEASRRAGARLAALG